MTRATAAMPAFFVVLWATGFVGAKLALPYIEPMTFLGVRFGVTCLILGAVAILLRRAWPKPLGLTLHLLVAGGLVHAFYLGGVFAAIDRGMPAGLSALIVGMQPLVTAVAAGPLFGERIRPRQWAGLALGLAGVATVLSAKLGGGGGALFEGFGLDAIAMALLGLVGITAGTLYQKRFCTCMDLVTGTTLQYLAAALLCSIVALGTESGRIVWSTDLWIALLWAIFGLSIVAILLLMLMIRRGEAYRTASLFYLVPPVAAFMGYLLFDERIGVLGLAGTAIVAVGVALVVMRPRTAAAG